MGKLCFLHKSNPNGKKDVVQILEESLGMVDQKIFNSNNMFLYRIYISKSFSPHHFNNPHNHLAETFTNTERYE